MLVFIILLVAAAIIFKVADTQLNKNNDKVLSSDARTLDKQRSMQTSKSGKLMRLLKATGLLITAEVWFIHAYVFLVMLLIFNDTGYTTSSFVDFFRLIVPIHWYIILTVTVVLLMRKHAKDHIAVLTIFILAHIAISVFSGFMYMDAYMPHEINVKYNPITIQREKARLEEKQAIAKQQEQEYQDYMAKKESYEIIFEKDLDDVQYKITKNNDVFYFEYKNKKNNDAFAKELTTSDDLAEITPERQRSLYDSDKYEMYFNSYIPAENNYKLLDYISIPSLGFYYEFDEYQYAYKDKYNMIIINNGRTSFNKFIHGLFSENSHFYELSYKDGMLIRSGEIGDRVGWDIYENGEAVLSRSAHNETELTLSDLEHVLQKGHTYTVYLTAYNGYLEAYNQVSKSVTFTY
jgi:hypothetical protein